MAAFFPTVLKNPVDRAPENVIKRRRCGEALFSTKTISVITVSFTRYVDSMSGANFHKFSTLLIHCNQLAYCELPSTQESEIKLPSARNGRILPA